MNLILTLVSTLPTDLYITGLCIAVLEWSMQRAIVLNLQYFLPEKAFAVLGVCTCIVGACGYECERVFTAL